jgi:hypothetical protein
MKETGSHCARLMRFVTGVLVLCFVSIPFLTGAVSAQDSGEGIVGDYSVTITKDAALPSVANSPMLVAAWHIGFHEDGTYLAERIDIGPMVQGSYTVDGDTVTITDESGTLSCTQPSTSGDATLDVAVGIYTFKRDDKGLTLTPQTDGCALRVILLSSSELGPYTACPVAPAGLGALATPMTPGTPVVADAATPITDPQSSSGDAEAQIDQLLASLTSCWLTGDVSRFLPLLTPEFQASFLSSGVEGKNASQQSRALASAMGAPLTFERAGTVRQVRDGEATCIVKTTLAGQESFARFKFVQVDGGWLWAGPA